MGHEITETDNLFTTRRPAWHGLGEVLPDYPTREEAQQIAHPWEPVTEPVYRAVPGFTEMGELTTTYEEIETHQAMVRSDNAHTLGVVTSSYEPVKNDEMYQIAEALQGESNDVMFETGGSVQGGAKVWLMLRLNEPLQVNGDPQGLTLPYFTLQNSHDASGAFRGQATNVRVVCANTMRASDLEAQRNRTEFVFHHTKKVRERIEEAKVALSMWRDNLTTWQHTMDDLIQVRITPQQREIFVQEMQPMPPEKLVSDRVRTNVETAREQLRDILVSPTTRDTAHTAYGLVAAAVEWNQHFRRTSGRDDRTRMENRFKRAMLSNDRFGADVIDLAREVSRA